MKATMWMPLTFLCGLTVYTSWTAYRADEASGPALSEPTEAAALDEVAAIPGHLTPERVQEVRAQWAALQARAEREVVKALPDTATVDVHDGIDDVEDEPGLAGDETTNTAMRGGAPYVQARIRQPNPMMVEARNALYDQWRSERVDADWTRQMWQEAERTLEAAELPLDKLSAVDCRQSLCRFQFVELDQDAAIRLHAARDESLSLFMLPVGADVEIFVTRPGVEIASLVDDDRSEQG